MNSPKILCIIPAYNAEKTIAQAIESIRNQVYPNIKIAVVDDGSSDATMVKAIFHNVRVYTLNKNIGTYQAVNHVLENETDFDFFYLHGADDLSYRNHFLELARPMQNNKIKMTWCNYRRVDINTGQSTPPIQGTRSSMVLWRREVIEKIGYYDNTRFGGDSEYWDRFLLYYHKSNMQHVDQALANCTTHDKNLTKLIGRTERLQYVEQYRIRHQKLIEAIH